MSDFEDLLAEPYDEEDAPIGDGPMSGGESENTGGSNTPTQPISAPVVPTDETPGWLRGLRGFFGNPDAGPDPYSYANLSKGSHDPSAVPLPKQRPFTADSVVSALNAGAAGELHGLTSGGDRALDQFARDHTDWIDATPLTTPLRNWSIEAERSEPGAFAAADLHGSTVSPINKVAGVAKFVNPTAGKGVVDVAARALAEGAIGAGDSALREYGDTGELYSQNTNAAISALASLPGAIVGNAASKSALRQSTPEARFKRAQSADKELLRSAGYTDDGIDQLLAQPEKSANVLTELRRLASEQPGRLGYTATDIHSSINSELDNIVAAKEAAAAELAARGATVDPMDVHDKLMSDVRAKHPGAASGVPAASDVVAGAQGVADRYKNMPRPVAQPVAAQGVELPQREPEPDAIGALAAQADETLPIDEMDLMPVRPAARYQPPAPPAAEGPSVVAAGPQAVAPPVAAQPPPLPTAAPAPADPVGALAAQAGPPPTMQDSVGAFGSLMGASGYDPGPARVPFNHFVDELGTVGQKIAPEHAKPEDMFQRERYAALDHAMDLGAERAGPELAGQWADAKANEGVLRLIDQESGAARNDKFISPLNWKDATLASILGGAGASVGGYLGDKEGAGWGGAAGVGLGLAAGRHLQPRMHAMQANWLGRDTAAMMERLSERARMPIGAVGASVEDAFTRPPQPEAAPENGPTSSLQGYPAGMTLGRDTTASMLKEPDIFMPWASDYEKAGSDDARAAVTERLARTDPAFAKNLLPLIQGGRGQIA